MHLMHHNPPTSTIYRWLELSETWVCWERVAMDVFNVPPGFLIIDYLSNAPETLSFGRLEPRSLSDLGRFYCGGGKSVRFFDHFR